MATGGNIFGGVPDTPLAAEEFTGLLAAPNVRIERILSTGQATPADQWYDQDWDEWVLLLRGAARLLFEGQAETRLLGPGDYVHIVAHRRHRVTWTDPDKITIWLAIHFPSACSFSTDASI